MTKKKFKNPELKKIKSKKAEGAISCGYGPQQSQGSGDSCSQGNGDSTTCGKGVNAADCSGGVGLDTW